MPFPAFSEGDIEAFRPTLKIGILGTITPEGLPHLTLISSLGASAPRQVIWGQFTEGRCKQYVRQNPKTGFLIMTLDKQVWRGSAHFSHTAQAGPDFDMYNNQPMFRYNAYFGIHTVYYMDLVEQSGRQPLPMPRIVVASVATVFARALSRRRSGPPVLNLWTRQLMNKLDNLKFIGFIGEDGYPVVLPIIQAQSSGYDRVIFALAPFGSQLRSIPAGASVAVFGMSLQMEDVLLRGPFLGVRRIGGVPCGVVEIEWVYNPMPPVPGQVFPPTEIAAVTAF